MVTLKPRFKICSPQLGLAPQSNSGGEVYDREVIGRLCQKEIKVLTLLPKNRAYQKQRNLSVEYAPIKTMYPPQVFSAFVLPYLIKTYKRERFDILRVHNPYFIGPAALIFKKLYPQVSVVASYLHLEAGVNAWIDRQVVNSFDHIITISKSTKKDIIETLNYPSEKISVAYPGVDQRFKPGEKIGKKFTIMFVGGLKARKNPEWLLKVLAKINRSDVQLVFAGDGPLKNKLTGFNVKVTGFVPEGQKPDLYHQADVVVLPSLKEGFGMTLVEAGASGLPVVGNNSWSMPEIIQDGVTGFLARPGDVEDWTQKLIKLIESESLRRKLGEAGRQLARNKFTWENNIKVHLKVYENLVR
ncbi:MAG: Glycosyl transferase group 1 [Candidatus Beckwithbacteria bacterium GW2011_GWC2_47_9]|uniref:Glycosyl transferase group 1 n=1 Tax=Candidatus Beckwithbacteria bacterium GW2011_GWC2_47_9 TaxID=1618373 RepID=A0A0G1WZ19_9BACT|nr:MAG: Glycosyl transferase group 1 [Candidatus Beckwithbacteria bacterium GW2011_GWC2_47_9]